MKKLKKYIGIALMQLALISPVFGQLDNLMIVEYVDWTSGDGVGIKIHNPTNSAINLDPYALVRYGNGNTTIDATMDLSGIIQPGQYRIYGNANYCDDCPSGCSEFSFKGVNGNDAVALIILATESMIDHIGPYGVETDITIDGTSDALDGNKVVRNSNNCIRYRETAGTSNLSWPGNPFDDATGWTVLGAACLDPNDNSYEPGDNIVLPDTTLCFDNATLDFSYLNGDSYNWVGLNSTSSSFTFDSTAEYTLNVTIGQCEYSDAFRVYMENCDSVIAPPPPPIDSMVDSVLFIPNILTPNQDSYNEVFTFTGTINAFPVQVRIFNRWGRKVYESLDYKQDWSPTEIPDGEYYYEIADVLNVYKGWLTIAR